MARKRASRFQEEQRKKKRSEKDALLSVGLSNLANALDDDRLLDQEDDDASQSKNWDDEEQDYELKPRSLKQEEQHVESLPIKRGGKVERVLQKAIVKETSDSEDDDEEEEEEAISEDATGENDTERQNQAEEEEEPDTVESILSKKEEIANLVERLMEDPEENIGALSTLLKMANSKNPNTSRFSLLAIVPALKSIVPGYRIRPLSDSEKKERVSRDVQKLRNFEQTLVIKYREYVQLLSDLSKNSLRNPSMSVLACKAACELATNFRDFNYRPDVFIIIIRRVCKISPKNDPVYETCVKCLENLLNDDDIGDVSFDVVRLLTKTLRSRKYKVDESTLNIFLSLNILSDYDPNATEAEKQEKLKIKKKDRPHLSKKERKARKERKEIDEELRKAEQKISEVEREKNQAEILKMLLKLYLDVLNERPQNLLASVLEGLAKIGHMANFELLGDFLVVFREIIQTVETEELEKNSSLSRHVLLSIATAFALVATHSQYKVQVDLSSFVDSLYHILFYVATDPEIEFSHKTLRLADPLSNNFVKPSVNISTRIELLLRGLEDIFFKSKNGSKTRALAFTKRLSMSLLHTPEKSSIALLKFLEKIMARYSEVAGLYSTEDRIANGRFLMEVDVPSRSNPDAATIYETFLLEKHYCPAVAKGAKTLISHAKDALK